MRQLATVLLTLGLTSPVLADPVQDLITGVRKDCRGCDLRGANFKKAEAFCPIVEASCAFINWALLARPPNATALRPIAEKTCGSAARAFIAALSLANC